MKKIITMFIIMTLLGYFFLIKRTSIEVGSEAIIIKKPWFWGESGVEPKSISSGTIWSVASTEVQVISLKAFSIEESFYELYTLDNIPLSLHLSLIFQNIEGRGVTLVEKFGSSNKWYKNFLYLPLKNSLETAIKQELYNEVIESRDIINKIKENILFGIRTLLEKQQIPVEVLDITFGTIQPPKSVVDIAIQSKIEEENLKIKKLKIKESEANAEADKAYMTKMNMSPREYLKIRKIELENQKLSLQRLAIEKAKDSNGSIKIEIKMEGL